MPTITERISAAVIQGDAAVVLRLTQEALAQGVPPADIFDRGLVPAMTVVGEKMQAGEYYIPEVLRSARAMKTAAELLRPLMVGSGARRPLGRIVLGTVEGDLHDIGKNLVGMMLEGAGFEVIDLGTSVPAGRFVEAAREAGTHIVGLSALLTTTMLHMKEVIRRLDEAECRPRVRVMVGGAPMSQRFCDDIGADGYSADAAGAVTLARRLVGAP